MELPAMKKRTLAFRVKMFVEGQKGLGEGRRAYFSWLTCKLRFYATK